MIQTKIRQSGLDTEEEFRFAQIIVDGYSSGNLEMGQLSGIIVKNGDSGATSFIIGASDGYVEQFSSGNVTFRGATRVMNNVDIDDDLRINIRDNGQDISSKSITSLETITENLQQTASLAIPAGAEVLGISIFITVQPPNTTLVNVGVSGSTISLKRYGGNISTTISTANRGMEMPGQFYVSSTPIIFTFNGVPSSAAGRIRLTIHYKQITPPTS